MKRRRIQNRVAESGFTLPVFSLFALCLWRPWRYAALPVDGIVMQLPTLSLLLLSCYVLMEWCNRRQIIRIRSRLTTSMFIVGASVLANSRFVTDEASCHSIVMLPSAAAGLALALGVVCCLFFLTSAYDRREPVLQMLHASFFLSAASLFCLPLLCLWPVMLFCMVAYMRVFSVRVLSSSVMGALLPWLFMSIWWLYSGALSSDSFSSVFSDAGMFVFPQRALLINYMVLSVLGLVSLIHFFMTSYDDKIRVRMIFYAIVMFWVALQAVMIVFTPCMPVLMPALWLVSCPLMAHHYALSSSRWTTFWFLLAMLSLLAGSFNVMES